MSQRKAFKLVGADWRKRNPPFDLYRRRVTASPD